MLAGCDNGGSPAETGRSAVVSTAFSGTIGTTGTAGSPTFSQTPTIPAESGTAGGDTPPPTGSTPTTTARSTASPAGNTPPPANSPQERARELADSVRNADGVDNEWALWLINPKNPLPDGYAPRLRAIGTERYLDERAAEYAALMLLAARNDGVRLEVISSYRTVQRQSDNFTRLFNTARGRGLSRQEAFDYTAAQIAVPGTSEHNAGVAIDFNLIDESFDRTPEYRWLCANAHKFGFIARYPAGTTPITGIIYEPWHFRFVGLYHAERIFEAGVTLEEYMGVCRNDDSVVEAYRRQFVG